MAQKVIWSHEALTDLELITDYIGKDSAYYASAFVEEVLDLAYSLSRFARRGSTVPEINKKNIREVFVNRYRLIYLIESRRVVILALVHGSRDFKKLLKDE